MALQAETEGYQLNDNSGDRFGFGFFVALVLHLIIIFGVVFERVDVARSNQHLDVTLVTHYSQQAPDAADFLAQANQQASGTLDEAAVPTSLDLQSWAAHMDEQGTEMQDAVQTDQGDLSNPLLTTRNRSDLKASNPDGQNPSAEVVAQTSASSRQLLLARLDTLQQDYAKRPKIGVLTSVAARARSDAEYQVHLQERVIEIGNQNYPEESFQQGLYGDLRMMLTILPDGSLESTEITESSGYPVLDRAAVKIARLAAPFAPFSRELHSRYDKIVFIRTWQFLPTGFLSTEVE